MRLPGVRFASKREARGQGWRTREGKCSTDAVVGTDAVVEGGRGGRIDRSNYLAKSARAGRTDTRSSR